MSPRRACLTTAFGCAQWTSQAVRGGWERLNAGGRCILCAAFVQGGDGAPGGRQGGPVRRCPTMALPQPASESQDKRRFIMRRVWRQDMAMLTLACLASHAGWKDFVARRLRCISMSSVKCTGLPCLAVRTSCRNHSIGNYTPRSDSIENPPPHLPYPCSIEFC